MKNLKKTLRIYSIYITVISILTLCNIVLWTQVVSAEQRSEGELMKEEYEKDKDVLRGAAPEKVKFDFTEEIDYVEAPSSVPTAFGFELKYSDEYNICEEPLNSVMGVKYFEDHRETYYSEHVLPGGGLDIPGRHVADDGTIRDEDGYIVVASDLSYLPRYETILTSLGPGKVYDCGCAYGTIDIYVSWE